VAGLAAMIRRSGGVAAVIERISQYSNSIVIGQVMVLVAGIILFFDPYASIIFIGELVSPFFRMFPVSLEKYAFLIQTTGVPVAAINPLSTWVGFSSALIQSQIDRLVDMGYEDLTIPDDGWMVFVRSIKYQFYPIFILCLVPMLIVSRRDLGPMLVKERERWLFLETGGITKSTLREKISRPSSDIPRLARNMWVPIGFWSISIWLTFGFISDPDSADNSTDFLAALIYSTIGAAAVTQFFYMLQRLEIQPKNGDHITEYGANRSIASALNMSRRSSRSIKSANADFILKNLQSSVSEDSELIGKVISHEGEQDEDDADIDIDLEEPNDELEDEEPLPLITKKRYKALVSLKEGANCFFKGGATVTPVLMTLTLAWATTAVFLDLGLDRLFADLINRGSIQTEMYATIGFFISCLLALATGSSTAAQAIVLPLLAIPLYVETDGNADLFYGLVGAVFSGSVVGDHASPISTSSILSSIIIECDLRDHILTQSPYIVFVAFLSVFAGHIPSAFERYPYYYGYAVGFVLLCCFVFFYCVDVLNEEGKYDFITSRFLSGRFASERLKDLKTRICMANGIEIIELKENLAALDTESASEPPSFETYDPQEYSRTMQTPDEDESVASSATSMSESISYKGRRGQNNSGRSNRSNHAGSRSRSRSTSRRSKRSLVDEQQAPSTPRKDASPSTRQSRTKSPSTRSHRSSSRSRPEGKTREVIQPKEQPRPSAPVEEEEPVGMKNNVMNWLRDAMSEDSTTTSGM
jgi:Na+/H+ antiporter NhaC